MNLIEILKDCPKGTKLYSTLYGEVQLDRIHTYETPDDGFIWVTAFDDSSHCFQADGRYYNDYYVDAECLLFPSKENRDWSTFNTPKQEFKKGDFVYRELTDDGKWVSIHCKIDKNNDEGNVISFADKRLDYNYLNVEAYPLTSSRRVKFERLATEEEKQQLLNALDTKGYIWDAEKLEIREKVKQIEERPVFKPFDKVLVRNYDNEKWHAASFSHYENQPYRYFAGDASYKQCIYYEGNEHLCGTTNSPIQWK
jgi:hypothetical protein